MRNVGKLYCNHEWEVLSRTKRGDVIITVYKCRMCRKIQTEREYT